MGREKGKFPQKGAGVLGGELTISHFWECIRCEEGKVQGRGRLGVDDGRKALSHL